MKTMFLIYGIPRFVDLPYPPPATYRLAVPVPIGIAEPAALEQPPQMDYVEFRISRAAVRGLENIPIYEPI